MRSKAREGIRVTSYPLAHRAIYAAVSGKPDALIKNCMLTGQAYMKADELVDEN